MREGEGSALLYGRREQHREEEFRDEGEGPLCPGRGKA